MLDHFDHLRMRKSHGLWHIIHVLTFLKMTSSELLNCCVICTGSFETSSSSIIIPSYRTEYELQLSYTWEGRENNRSCCNFFSSILTVWNLSYVSSDIHTSDPVNFKYVLTIGNFSFRFHLRYSTRSWWVTFVTLTLCSWICRDVDLTHQHLTLWHLISILTVRAHATVIWRRAQLLLLVHAQNQWLT